MWKEIEHGKQKWKADSIEYTKSIHVKSSRTKMHYVQSPSAELSHAVYSLMNRYVYWYDTYSTPFQMIENSTGQKLNKRCIISSSGNWLNGTHEEKKTTTTTCNMFVLAYFIYFQRKKETIMKRERSKEREKEWMRKLWLVGSPPCYHFIVLSKQYYVACQDKRPLETPIDEFIYCIKIVLGKIYIFSLTHIIQ